MIGTIRKHSKWLWLVIVTATIISFGWWGSYTKASRNGQGAGGGNFGSIDGVPVTAAEYQRTVHEVYLRYFVQSGQWPDKNPQSGFDEQRDTYQRLFLLRKLKEYNIVADSASVAQMADEILRGLGRGNPVPLDAFVQQVLAPRGMNDQDFQRYLQHDLGIQQLMSILGLSGKLVSPEEARSLYEHEYRELSTEAVVFSAPNFLTNVATPPPEVLQRFYSNNAAEYRIPDRVQVTYVEFGITNKFAEVEKTLTNLTAVVDANFRQAGTNYVRFGKTEAEAKLKIRELVLQQEATKIARQQADRFAGELVDMEPMKAANLAALAKTNGLAVKLTMPFDEQNGPSAFDGGPNFAKAAFSLTADAPIASQPLVGEDAVYVIALDRRIPSEVPAFDMIRERVMVDYKFTEALKLAQAACQSFVQTATNALAGGKTFDAICANAGVKPVSLPPFSQATGDLSQVLDHVNLRYFKQVSLATPAGKVTPAIGMDNGAMVVYVRQQMPLDQTKMTANMPAFLNAMRRMRQGEAVNEWFAKEASRALSKIQFEPSKRTATAPGKTKS